MQEFNRNVNPAGTIPRVSNPWTDRIKIVSIHRTAQAGTIKAFATVLIGAAIEISGFKIIQQAGQRAWVAMPDRKREDTGGYAPIIKCLDDQLKAAITEAVLVAWHAGGAA
jgi:DNA-binding cell septation regulator SpoVG